MAFTNLYEIIIGICLGGSDPFMFIVGVLCNSGRFLRKGCNMASKNVATKVAGMNLDMFFTSDRLLLPMLYSFNIPIGSLLSFLSGSSCRMRFVSFVTAVPFIRQALRQPGRAPHMEEYPVYISPPCPVSKTFHPQNVYPRTTLPTALAPSN